MTKNCRQWHNIYGTLNKGGVTVWLSGSCEISKIHYWHEPFAKYLYQVSEIGTLNTKDQVHSMLTGVISKVQYWCEERHIQQQIKYTYYPTLTHELQLHSIMTILNAKETDELSWEQSVCGFKADMIKCTNEVVMRYSFYCQTYTHTWECILRDRQNTLLPWTIC